MQAQRKIKHPSELRVNVSPVDVAHSACHVGVPHLISPPILVASQNTTACNNEHLEYIHFSIITIFRYLFTFLLVYSDFLCMCFYCLQLTRFKIVPKWASVVPRSSSVYFLTCDVIVFIIINMVDIYQMVHVCIVTTRDNKICW